MLPLRLPAVAGLAGRVNDTLFLPASTRPPDPQTLVFFGGDVQDYPEVMQVHRDNRKYVHWNLESTATLLSQNFPHKHIVVVRPSRIERKLLSCYDNFVPSSRAGVPDHVPDHSALAHLERLLNNVSIRVKEMPVAELLEAVGQNVRKEIDAEKLRKSTEHESAMSCAGASGSGSAAPAPAPAPESNPLWWVSELSLQRSRLTLAGFSKGCVVLNQLVHEFHAAEDRAHTHAHDFDARRFMGQIEAIYWLDGGHAGGKDTWLTSRALLRTLATLDIDMYVHVSPYQVRDEARPWIRREEKAFTTTLTKLGAKVSRFLHDSPAPHSLLTHFSVLENFKRVQDAGAGAGTPCQDQRHDIDTDHAP